MAARLRKGDTVVVISGKDKGKSGKVTRILRDDDSVVVEGINMVKRHTQADAAQPAGRHHRARAAASTPRKVMPVDPKTGKRTRVRFKTRRERQQGSRRAKSGEEIPSPRDRRS